MSFALWVPREEGIPGVLPDGGEWREEGEHGCVRAEVPPQTPKAAGAEWWLVAALPARGCPSSAPLPHSGSCCTQCKLGRGM